MNNSGLFNESPSTPLQHAVLADRGCGLQKRDPVEDSNDIQRSCHMCQLPGFAMTASAEICQ